MFINGVNDASDKVFSGANDIADKFITGVVSTTLVFALFHGFSVIGGVVDTGNITSVADTAEQLSPVTTTLAIN
jgi:hypothetical protein